MFKLNNLQYNELVLYIQVNLGIYAVKISKYR
jgi:hypothetical protein